MSKDTIELSFHQHGKSKVRVGRKWKTKEGKHYFSEWVVESTLESGMDHAYIQGDNTGMTATDTQKNTIYHIAHTMTIPCSPEKFAMAIAKHFVNKYDKVTKAKVIVEQLGWERYTIENEEHYHGFCMKNNYIRIAEVSFDDKGIMHCISGIKDFKMMKTTQSGYEGFIQDELTSLPYVTDRILATSLTSKWKYKSELMSIDFDKSFSSVMNIFLQTFFGDCKEGVYSPSVQNTLYLMAKDVIEKLDEIEYVHVKMPNLHFLPSKNYDDVYIATNEPHGTIEALVSRKT